MRSITGLVPHPLNPEITAYWTMWGTVATALATAGLVVLATFAWSASLATLRGQQRSDELAAMTAYLRALKDLSNIQKATPAKFAPPPMGNQITDMARLRGAHETYSKALCQEVEVSGSVWRAHHHNSKTIGAAFRESERILIEAQEWWRDPEEGTEDGQDDQFVRNAKFAAEIANEVLHWQTRKARRSDLRDLMDKECRQFIAESPCRPTRISLSFS